MKSFLVFPAATLAAAAALTTALHTRSQDRPADPSPPPVVAEVCPAPCAHCVLTGASQPAPEPTVDPAAPRRRAPPEALPEPAPADPAPRRGQPVTEPQEPAQTPPAGEAVPLPSGAAVGSRAMALIATVTLPDGQPYMARAPLPSDRDGFTWRTFKNRASGKQILGLHVYAPRQEPDLVVGTLRWSNGAVRPNGKDFCGLVYYDSFTVTAPQGWEWVTLPTKGQVTRGPLWVVIAAPAQGDHLARPREMLEWPYALVPVGNEQARARAEAALKYQDLVIPDPVVDYGPTKSTLPRVDRAKYASTCRAWVTSLLDAQAKGRRVFIDNIADVQADQIGAHWMDGSNWGYAHGGYGIDPTGSAPEQVPDAVLARAIMHRANVARQFLAAYDLETGQPIGLYDWTSPPNPALMSGEPGKEGTVEILPFLTGDYYTYRYPRFNTGECLYEYTRTATVGGVVQVYPGLWTYETHDVAHSIRAMRHAIALVEFAKDPAARDDLLMFAEVGRYGWFSDRSDERTRKKNPGDGYWHQTLTGAMEALRDKPHQGGWFDRNWAWSAFGGACAIAYDPNAQRVERWRAWGRNMLDAASLATDKFGFAGRNFSPGNMPATVSGIQTFHEMLVMTHRVTLALQVHGAVPPELAAINRLGLTSALSGLTPRPYGGSIGPPHWIGTADNNVELPALTEAYCYGEGDPAHVHAAVAMTYRADPTHAEVLNLALPHWHPSADLPAMLEFCSKMFPNKAWGSEMEAVLQQKLAR